MTPPARDRWAQWLLERRHGGDPALRKALLAELEERRDRVLERARVRSGDVLLDVGAGDGLIAFGAIDLIGPRGMVIFSDISQDLLDHARALAEEIGVSRRCRFVRAAAEDLAGIDASSVDMVTTRSVLIYVKAKEAAFAEFFRVLQPGGRLSILEPINRLMYPEPPNELFGYDVGAIRDLADKVKTRSRKSERAESTLTDFDERDLMRMGEAAGFKEIHLELDREVVKERRPMTWESLLGMSWNPLIPTNGEIFDRAFTDAERRRFEAHLRPLVESGLRTRRLAMASLWAEKPR